MKPTQSINPQSNRMCKACGLYLNQLPATGEITQAEVFWVGLSAVAFTADEDRVPLSPTTRSGALIAEIESGFLDSGYFYKTNLVKCLPLRENKIRYPIAKEMEKCFPNLEKEVEELKPKVIFLLGKQVASFVLDRLGISSFGLDEDFKYQGYEFRGITYVPVHHPSYVLVYKRKNVSRYISNIRSVIEEHCVFDHTLKV